MLQLFLAIVLSQGLFAGPQQITWATPTQVSTTGVNASQVQVVEDSNGNVTGAWLENGSVVTRYLPSGGSWGSATTLTSVSSSSLNLGVDSNGNVTALWVESGVVHTANKTFGGSWSGKSSISGSGASQARLSIASNGNAVAVWTRNGFIEASTKLLGLLWDLVVAQLSSGGSEDNPDVFLGSNGTTIAVWHTGVSGTDALQSSTALVLGTWKTAVNISTLPAGVHFNYPRVAVDSNGNAIAVWFSYALSGSTYSNVSVQTSSLAASSTSWTVVPTTLTTNLGLLNPASLQNEIKFDGSGNAFALWTNSYDGANYALESAMLPVGGSWQFVGQIVEQNHNAFQGDVFINSAGHGLIGYMWFDGTNIAVQAVETDLTSPFPNSFTIPVTVSSGTDNGYPRVGFSTTSTTLNAAAIWQGFDGTHTTILASTGTETLIQPATSLSVAQSSNNFGIFTEYYNTFSWTDSTTPSVVTYVIYRNGFIISEVPSTATQFIDHNAVQNGSVTYGIVAVDSSGEQSPMATKSFP
jgi:hypothetical protein